MSTTDKTKAGQVAPLPEKSALRQDLEEAPKQGLLDRWPHFQRIAAWSSIIGLPLAIYFYVQTLASRDLQFYINPARAVVAKADSTSRLTLAIDGTPVDQDLSAVQIQFWNEGKIPIRMDSMLKPLRIKTVGNAPIIEAVVRKRSRDVTGIAIDSSAAAAKGEITLSWTILEKGDGAIVQVIFLGDLSTEISATATVEGQGDLVFPVAESVINLDPASPFGKFLAIISGVSANI